MFRRPDIQHNDTQKNDTQHNNTQHNKTQQVNKSMKVSITTLNAECSYAQLCIVIVTLSVILRSVVMLNVVAPSLRGVFFFVMSKLSAGLGKKTF